MPDPTYTQAELEAAIKKAVKEALAKQKTAKKTVTTTESLSKIPGMNAKIGESFKALSTTIDKLFGVGSSAYGGLEEFGEMGRDKYDRIQKQFGGIRDVTAPLTETAKQSVQAFDDIYANYYGNTDAMKGLMVEVNGEMVNATTAFFGDVADISDNYMQIRHRLANRQSVMFNKMTREDQVKMGTYAEGFQISNDKVAQILERQISTTGEASTKIFDEMSAYATAVSEKTGVSFQEISEGIANIITDVERFGNVQVDEAARIAGSLNELGLSYQGFGGMVDKFMNFDQAADSLGNLTTVFGVHFDAMEMMQLANEDQEEFLYRMRDAFLDSGKAVEDMTLAEKKLAAQQLGMSIQDFENFMQEDRELSDLESVTKDVDPSEGFEQMTKNMKLVQRTGEEMKQFMINKVMDPLAKEGYNLANSMAAYKDALVLNPQKVLPGYQEFQAQTQASVRATLSTGSFDDDYRTEVMALKELVAKGDLQVKDQVALLQKAEELATAQNVTFKDYMKLIGSLQGGGEFLSVGTQLLGERVVEGMQITDQTLNLQKYKKQIEAGEKINFEEFESDVRKEFLKLSQRAEAESLASDQSATNNQLEKNQPKNNQAQGQSSNDNTMTVDTGPQINNNQQGALEQKQNQMQLEETRKQTEAINNSAEEAQKNTQKTTELEAKIGSYAANQEDRKYMEKLSDKIESQTQAFKDLVGGLRIVNKLEIDGVTLGLQLMKIKTPGGQSFAVINQGGDQQ